ncbi:MAG TPA: histone deacetylase family protein [Gammaproteobacteria bacterium]|nr:histone deacetylase family protein [Gammaproteobacteria bacterium]
MPLALISHPLFRSGPMPAIHPDQPRRIEAIDDRLIASGLDMVTQAVDAPCIDETTLHRVHDPAYVAELRARTPETGWTRLDADTWLGPDSLTAALHAAGGAAAGVDLVLAGQATAAFVLGRPPGHHAGRAHAGGFCLINHIAVAAARARKHGLARIALVDFDAHAGDGTEALVAEEPTLRMYSLYQEHGFAAPAGPAAGNIRRLAMPPGGDGAVLREGVEAHWLADLAAFAPQIVLVSAGFDGHREDDMADLGWVEGDYAWLVSQLKAATGAPMVLSLEGGYAPAALGRSVHAVLNSLLDAG